MLFPSTQGSPAARRGEVSGSGRRGRRGGGWCWLHPVLTGPYMRTAGGGAGCRCRYSYARGSDQRCQAMPGAALMAWPERMPALLSDGTLERHAGAAPGLGVCVQHKPICFEVQVTQVSLS